MNGMIGMSGGGESDMNHLNDDPSTYLCYSLFSLFQPTTAPPSTAAPPL